MSGITRSSRTMIPPWSPSRPAPRRSNLKWLLIMTVRANPLVKRVSLPDTPRLHARRFVSPDATRASWFPSWFEQTVSGSVAALSGRANRCRCRSCSTRPAATRTIGSTYSTRQRNRRHSIGRRRRKLWKRPANSSVTIPASKRSPASKSCGDPRKSSEEAFRSRVPWRGMPHERGG